MSIVGSGESSWPKSVVTGLAGKGRGDGETTGDGGSGTFQSNLRSIPYDLAETPGMPGMPPFVRAGCPSYPASPLVPELDLTFVIAWQETLCSATEPVNTVASR